MAVLAGFTRPIGVVNGDQLTAQVSAAIGIAVDAQVDATQAIVSGPITETNRVAIQTAINAYAYVPFVAGELAITKGMVGLGQVDNTSDVAKPVSTAVATSLSVKADATALSTKADASELTNNLAAYRTILESSGSHLAGKVAGVYGLGFGDPTVVSGGSVLYPLQILGLLAADQPTVTGLPAKLRVRGVVTTNATAPSGNFTLGLYPVTKGGGAVGLSIYTLGAVIAGSQPAAITTPGANSMNGTIGSDFSFPADGIYCLGVLTSATVATSSLVHIVARLQVRNA